MEKEAVIKKFIEESNRLGAESFFTVDSIKAERDGDEVKVTLDHTSENGQTIITLKFDDEGADIEVWCGVDAEVDGEPTQVEGHEEDGVGAEAGETPEEFVNVLLDFIEGAINVAHDAVVNGEC